jgi:hypothetical protein
MSVVIVRPTGYRPQGDGALGTDREGNNAADIDYLIFYITLCLCLPFQVRWLLYVPPVIILKHYIFCPHSAFNRFVWFSE